MHPDNPMLPSKRVVQVCLLLLPVVITLAHLKAMDA